VHAERKTDRRHDHQPRDARQQRDLGAGGHGASMSARRAVSTLLNAHEHQASRGMLVRPGCSLSG